MFNKQYIQYLIREIEELKKDKSRLIEDNQKLQAAIVAKESPMAYEHFAKPDDNPENKEKTKQAFNEMQALKRFSELSEGPLFSSADEMIHTLGTAMGVPKHKAIHNNDES